MKLIAVSQRVDIVPSYGERRDALDQRWTDFLRECDLLPILIPNDVAAADNLIKMVPMSGVLLTGGNDLAAYGGNVPERDATEKSLLRTAMDEKLPVLGVCHGMQVVQTFFGVELQPVSGHVTPQQTIRIEGVPSLVNSYHRFGATTTVSELIVWAESDDHVVKAVRHRSHKVSGLMWHPERMLPFREEDIRFFSLFFGSRG